MIFEKLIFLKIGYFSLLIGILRPGSIKIERGMKKYFWGLMTFAGHQWASHQAKKSENKTPGIFGHAAFDFDAPRPQKTH